jgi:hypothetical protein
MPNLKKEKYAFFFNCSIELITFSKQNTYIEQINASFLMKYLLRSILIRVFLIKFRIISVSYESYTPKNNLLNSLRYNKIMCVYD